MEYLYRVHTTLADNGFFSPRLFNFLGIDYKKVHSEEEGALMALLDSPNNPLNTVWHIIDEGWLVKWRRFAMGRGPRRYVPPGRITNDTLLQVFRAGGKKSLKISTNYRCVNYNVWRFYELVHGGGPCISRKEEDIYSAHGVSHLQGVIMVQTHMRMYLARLRRRTLYMIRLSGGQIAKSVLIKATQDGIKVLINGKIREEELKRKGEKLTKAALLTQNMWRKKKNYLAEESLERVKRDQEVFARAKGVALDEPTGTGGLVVRDLHPIIHIGNTTMYERRVTEEEGKVPFKIKKIPGSETAIIAESENDQVGLLLLS